MKQMVTIMMLFVALGLVICVVSASADYTGLNVTQEDREAKEFGTLQTFGLITGVVIIETTVMLGAYIIKMKRRLEIEEPAGLVEFEDATTEIELPAVSAS